MNRRKLLARIIENWPAKVLSLALAIILFVFHRMITLETRSFFSPLIIENMNAIMPSSTYPRQIRVSLKGETASINSVLEDEIEVFVNMENISVPGVYNIPVQWRKKGTALGVEPLQISIEPEEINFSLDNRISRLVPIAASFRGMVEAGYNMTSYILNPAQAAIEGPAGIVNSITELNTELIDLESQKGDFSVTAAILQLNPLVIIRGNGITEFHGTVTPIIPVRNISNVPIEISGLKEGLTAELEIKTGSLHLEGSRQDLLLDFEPGPGFLSVDCSDINEPGEYILRIITGSFENLSILCEPREVKITIYNGEEDEQDSRDWS